MNLFKIKNPLKKMPSEGHSSSNSTPKGSATEDLFSDKITRRNFLGLAAASLYSLANPGEAHSKPVELEEYTALEFKRQKGIMRLANIYSTPYEEIESVISSLNERNFVYDPQSLTEVRKLNRMDDLGLRCLNVVKLLSVQTREQVDVDNQLWDFLMNPENLDRMRIIYSYNLYIHNKITYSQFLKKVRDLETEFDGLVLPDHLNDSDKRNLSSTMRTFIDEYYTDEYWFRSNYPDYRHDNNAWTQVFPYMYALEILNCLGLKHTLSSEVDADGSPVFYRNMGRSVLPFVNKDGNVLRPSGQISKLSSNETLKWLGENGKKYGWVDVTTYSLDRKINLLREGYIFYGSSFLGDDDINNAWIVFGLSIDGSFEPVLTQAHVHRLLTLFSNSSLKGKPLETLNLIRGINDRYFFAPDSKLLGDGGFQNSNDTKIYAIKVDDHRIKS